MECNSLRYVCFVIILRDTVVWDICYFESCFPHDMIALFQSVVKNFPVLCLQCRLFVLALLYCLCCLELLCFTLFRSSHRVDLSFITLFDRLIRRYRLIRRSVRWRSKTFDLTHVKPSHTHRHIEIISPSYKTVKNRQIRNSKTFV